jgi:hypothetical protein
VLLAKYNALKTKKMQLVDRELQAELAELQQLQDAVDGRRSVNSAASTPAVTLAQHQAVVAALEKSQAKNAQWKTHHANTKAQLRELEGQVAHVHELQEQVVAQQLVIQTYQVRASTRSTDAMRVCVHVFACGLRAFASVGRV